jgi:hypothetical protein
MPHHKIHIYLVESEKDIKISWHYTFNNLIRNQNIWSYLFNFILHVT